MHILAATQHASAGGIIAFILIWMAVLAAYWAPTVVALIRHVPNTGSVIVLNVFGFTLICWVIALAMAVRSKPPPQYLAVPVPGYPMPQANPPASFPQQQIPPQQPARENGR